MNKAQIQYLLWLDQNHPGLYRALYSEINQASLSATETPAAEPSTWDKIVSGLQDLVPVYLATEQQKQLNEINLQRAKNGLPPVDASDASTISTQVGLSDKTRNTLLLGTGILGAAFVLPKVLRK